jgi:selenide,water dikinase
VATVDFFTPMVDSAYDFGRIAAANALSDVYAMGGRPLFALNLVGFPRDMLATEILPDIVRGAADIAREAGVPIVGGHSVDDPEPKFGLCVIGEVHPARIVRNNTARVGDALILTKAIGTGIIATALKKDAASTSVIENAVASMVTLNRAASEIMLRADVSAATDVTGFGLLGHLASVLRQSGAGARVDAAAVPLLPGALELAHAGFVPGGTKRNAGDVGAAARFSASVSADLRTLLFDAQTSGGLLMCVRRDQADDVVAELRRAGSSVAAVIGEITPGPAGTIEID